MARHITRKYTNGEVTVVWKPGGCIHSAKCFTGLPAVFDPRARPWLNIRIASTEAIVAQVRQCPSGALSVFRNDATDGAPALLPKTTIEVLENGPLLVHGRVAVQSANGTVARPPDPTALCRCGGSANKPYCDGTHRRNGFRG
jgi:uncharacterized Fe-S cluster protein YjdI